MTDDLSITISPGETHLIFVSNNRAGLLDMDDDLSYLSARDVAILAALLELAVRKVRPLLGERVL